MGDPYGKHVLVTGASSGIGKVTAELFAEHGFTVWAAARSVRAGSERRGPGELRYLPMDVTSEGSVARAVAEIAAGGGLGIVVHSAGMGIAGAAEDTPEEAIRDQFEVNFFGVLRVNRHALPLLRERHRGLVLIVGSVAGRVPLPFQSHYSATKYALDSYAESLRIEAGPLGIDVTVVEPGDTRTGFTDARRLAVPDGSPYAARVAKAVATMARDERAGTPPEVAARAMLALAQRRRPFGPPIRVTIGSAYKAVLAAHRVLPGRVFARMLARRYG